MPTASEGSDRNADTAWKAKPFNRAFAVYIIAALLVVGLVMGYFLFSAVREATPGVHSSLVPSKIHAKSSVAADPTTPRGDVVSS